MVYMWYLRVFSGLHHSLFPFPTNPTYGLFSMVDFDNG